MVTKKYIIIFLILSISFAINLTGTTRSALAITISASANWAGQPDPVTLGAPYTLPSGNFTIIGSAVEPYVGDGVNEDTDWAFNFSSDPNYAAFLAEGKITSAILYLTLIPQDQSFDGDKVRMASIPHPSGSSPDIPINPIGWVIGTDFYFSVDLMQSGEIGVYTSENILDVLMSSGGKIPMHFYDDALVKYARLDLTATPVPLPGAVWLLGSGLLGLGSWRRFKKS